MNINFSQLSFYLLQESYFKEDDPVGAMIFIIVLGSLIVIGIISSLIRYGLGSTNIMGKRERGSAPVRRFSALTLRKIANNYGLDKDQTKILEYVFKSEGLNDPERVLANPMVLDKHFKRAYKRIERAAGTEDEALQQHALLFSVRNAIETVQNTSPAEAPKLTENMSAVLAVAGESYPIRILSTKGDHVIIECPVNALGSPIKINKGSKVNISFFTKTAKGFAYETTVLGNTSTSKGPALQLARLGKAKNLVQRRHKRRQVGAIPCIYHIVFVEEVGSGRKKEVKMTVDPRRYKGNLIDLSIGGCAMRTTGSVNVGTRLKLEFEDEESTQIAVLGQVLRLNRGGASSTIMHIKFTKVPRKSANAINATVFEYNEN